MAKRVRTAPPPKPSSSEEYMKVPEDAAEKLSDFLNALDEWGVEDNLERARVILDFQRDGYDLSEYEVEE
jgi:hypothetical protein